MQTGEAVLITKHGKPVAKMVPADQTSDDVFGFMAGKVKIVGDIVGPVAPLGDFGNPSDSARHACVDLDVE